MKGNQIMKNRNTIFTTITLALGFFALLPTGQAVSPAPDGDYAGANTAEGSDALFSLTSGTRNTALGFQALYTNTTGYENTATGLHALFSNTTGFYNTANGDYTLSYNTTGDRNTATGVQALYRNTTGSYNTATGLNALFHNTTGNWNTANGVQALNSNTTGDQNTANGYLALFRNTDGNGNTAIGFQALYSNTDGLSNTAVGAGALYSSAFGLYNTANGSGALYSNTTGYRNTAVGDEALVFNTTGTNNVALGESAGSAVTTASNVICIGADGHNVDNACYIGQIFDATLSGGVAVYINSNGRLGTTTSSRRFKEEIKPMDRASEAILALKPVSFRYKKEIDAHRIAQFGLVAEEVEKVSADLVVRDKKGKPYSVRYEQVNAMLLNEFLKEHRKVEKLEATVAQQQKDFQATVAKLTERLDEHAAQIQKVSVQIQMNKPAPQMVVNP
jgi:hypothetical protein